MEDPAPVCGRCQDWLERHKQSDYGFCQRAFVHPAHRPANYSPAIVPGYVDWPAICFFSRCEKFQEKPKELGETVAADQDGVALTSAPHPRGPKARPRRPYFKGSTETVEVEMDDI